MTDPREIPGLTFAAPTHRYQYNGVDVPNTTAILQAAGLVDFSHVDPDVLQHASIRGQKVHRAIEMYQMAGDTGSMDVEVEQRFDGFLKFKRMVQPNLLRCESRVFSIRHWYAGTFDDLSMVAGYRTLIDWKCVASLNTRAVEAQLASYGAAWDERNPDLKHHKRLAVQLLPGDFRLHYCEGDAGWLDFIRARRKAA